MKEFSRELRDYLRAINPMPHIHELEQQVKRFYCHFNRARRLFWQMELYLREREKMAKSASSVNGAAGTNGH